MKKMITALTLSITLALSACGGNTTTDEPKVESTDDKYVSNLKERIPAFENADTPTLIRAGKGVCDYFNEFGVSADTLVLLSDELQETFTLEQTAAILLTSTESYCPGVRDDIMDMTGGNV